MKKGKKIRVADALMENMSMLGACVSVDSLSAEVVRVVKLNYDDIADREAADKLLKIVRTTRNKTALLSTIATYITNVKVC